MSDVVPHGPAVPPCPDCNVVHDGHDFHAPCPDDAHIWGDWGFSEVSPRTLRYCGRCGSMEWQEIRDDR